MSGSRHVVLRARSGRFAGMGHVVRCRSVAEAVVARGGSARLVVDDEASARYLRDAGLDAVTVLDDPNWSHVEAAGAVLDGFADWSEKLRDLARRGTPGTLIENRTVAREFADTVLHPSLHFQPDHWEQVHAGRVHGGPAWIPLRGSVLMARQSTERDVDLLVTFGGSDPARSTERVLAAAPAGLRVAVSVGEHMQARRADIERSARHLRAEVLPTQVDLVPWMARARVAVTAVGTTLYELAYLRTPALILANYEHDLPVLDHYRAHGPFHPLGLAAETDGPTLSAWLAQALAPGHLQSPLVPELGDGAARIVAHLLGEEHRALAA